EGGRRQSHGLPPHRYRLGFRHTGRHLARAAAGAKLRAIVHGRGRRRRRGGKSRIVRREGPDSAYHASRRRRDGRPPRPAGNVICHLAKTVGKRNNGGMALQFTTNHLEDSLSLFRYYKKLG